MASSKQVLLLLAVVACLASPASATQWVVGDECGWRPQFNETRWADGKTFVAGDTLLFMYPKEKHTVVEVGEDDFAACNLEGNQLRAWDCGHDVVQLDKPGKAWFICTKLDHCLNGMKLVIDVVDPLVITPAPPLPAPFPSWPWGSTSTPAPAPTSPAAATPSAAVTVRYLVGGTVAAAAAAVVVVATLAF